MSLLCCACSDHSVVETWDPDGSYRRHRVCKRFIYSWICSDKHLPTFRAAAAAGFKGTLLDLYHGHHAVSNFLLTIQVKGYPAAAFGWAFRLWQRSGSDAKASAMRNQLVSFILSHVEQSSGGDASSEQKVGAKEQLVTLKLDRGEGGGRLGFSVTEHNRIDKVHEGSVASQAGLQIYDRVISVNGLQLSRHVSVGDAIARASNEQICTLAIMRALPRATAASAAPPCTPTRADADAMQSSPSMQPSPSLHPQAALEPFWTLAQACQLIDYFDSCWQLPDIVRMAWIDATILTLDEDLVPSTGGCEGSHRWWDDHMFQHLHNRDVTTVAMKTTGTTLNGDEVYNFFGAQETRWRKAKEKGISVDVHVCQSKADYAFLLHKGESVLLVDDATAFVRRTPEDSCIRRHAVPTAHAFDRFPDSLWPMRRMLAHAGPHSFERQEEDWYTVCRQTGRCDCDASHRLGVRTERGPCKHRREERLATRAAESAEQAAAVCSESFNRLLNHVHERERSRPQALRCMALYTATALPALLEALAAHPSIPPSGTSTGLDDAPSRGQLEVSAADLPFTGAKTEEFSCTFSASSDFGIIFGCVGLQNDDELVDMLVVRAFSRRLDGSLGPAPHGGHQLHPGDMIIAIDGIDDCENLCPMVSTQGVLSLPRSHAEGPVTMHCMLGQCRSAPMCSEGADEGEETIGDHGGRPEKRTAKFPRQQHQPGSRGGAAPRKGKKPQATPATQRQAVKPPQIAAGEDVATAVATLRARLLDVEHLTEQALHVRAELEDATYVR